MQRYIPHIASFFLLLSVAFVFPLQHLHECEEKAAAELVQNLTGGEDSPSFQAHCDLCDLVFPPSITPENQVALSTPILLGHYIPSLTETLPKVSISYFHLRAPPIG